MKQRVETKSEGARRGENLNAVKTHWGMEEKAQVDRLQMRRQYYVFCLGG